MSDGQVFYTAIVCFYLLSCFKPSATNGLAIHKRVFKGWQYRNPLMTLGGIRKSIYLSPLCPWPSSIVIAQGHSSGQRLGEGSMASSIRLIRLLHRASADLRWISLNVLILFLGVIPFLYLKESASFRTYMAIGMGLLLMLVAGIRFVGLHRRFAPQEKGERYKQFFFALTMPWHTMRLADELMLIPRVLETHPLALATMADDLRGMDFRAQITRDAIYLKKPRFSETEVNRVWKSMQVDTSAFTQAPVQEDPESCSYCPCCHGLYTASVNNCSDCDQIELVRF